MPRRPGRLVELKGEEKTPAGHTGREPKKPGETDDRQQHSTKRRAYSHGQVERNTKIAHCLAPALQRRDISYQGASTGRVGGNANAMEKATPQEQWHRGRPRKKGRTDDKEKRTQAQARLATPLIYQPTGER